MSDPLIIRTDGSAEIGTGHVMRCLALAQMWRSLRGPVIFVQSHTTDALSRRLRAEGFDLQAIAAERGSAADAELTVRLARKHDSRWVVADGYCFDGRWQSQVRASDLRLLVIDDCAEAAPYDADLILNQNLSAEEAWYRDRSTDARLLLGSSYVLLRREFRALSGRQREHPSRARRILVTMGGSDPFGLTPKVLTALQDIPELEIVVIIGGSNPNSQQLDRTKQSPTTSVRWAMDPPDVPELMASADCAISAAGSTTWELGYLGVPTLLISVAENQRALAAAADAQGLARHLGWHEQVTAQQITADVEKFLGDVKRREWLSSNASRRIDGEGVVRVLRAMEDAA